MEPIFGKPSTIFAPGTPNQVKAVAGKISAYLASYSQNGCTSAIYYACGIQGSQIEEIGDLSEEDCALASFNPPKKYGTGTQILPAINYYREKFRHAPWSMVIFITDGQLDDLEAAKQASKEICLELQAGTRGFTKYVIIGVGDEFRYADSAATVSIAALDDLDGDERYAVAGHDLWDHKIAAQMQSLEEIFAEVVDESLIVCPSAKVLDSFGNEVRREGGGSYNDGLPPIFTFTMPASSTSFTILLPDGTSITQDIREGL